MLLAGGEMIFMPGFDAEAIIDAMEGATTLMGVPTFYTRLLDNPRLGHQAASGMRLFISARHPCWPVRMKILPPGQASVFLNATA